MVAPDAHDNMGGMAGYMLQINYGLTVPVDQYTQMAGGAAHLIAQVDGLRWKIWIVNEAEREAGGFYHFDTKASAEAFVNGPIIANLRAAPFATGVVVKGFDYVEGLTDVCHGPVEARIPSTASVGTTSSDREVRL
jgi:hypothetical protein